MQTRAIDRIDGLSATEFQRRANFERPVVLTAATMDWPAWPDPSIWSIGGLKRLFGNLEVPLRATDDLFEYRGPKNMPIQSTKPQRLGTYFDRIAQVRLEDQSRPPYLVQELKPGYDPKNPAEGLSALLEHCHFPDAPSEYEPRFFLWVAAPGQKGRIHHDGYHNFNYQLAGRKRFLLFAPDEYRNLYPEIQNIGHWYSPVNPEAPDHERFPAFDNAQGLEAVLGPGEMLFIPRFWWHQVKSLEAAININRWFTPRAGALCWHLDPAISDYVVKTHPLEKLLAAIDAALKSVPELRSRIEFVRERTIAMYARTSPD